MKLSWLAHKSLVWVETNSKVRKTLGKSSVQNKFRFLKMSKATTSQGHCHNYSEHYPFSSYVFYPPCVLRSSKIHPDAYLWSLITLWSQTTHKKTAKTVTLSSLGERWSNEWPEWFLEPVHVLMCTWTELTVETVKGCN